MFRGWDVAVWEELWSQLMGVSACWSQLVSIELACSVVRCTGQTVYPAGLQ